MTRQRRNDAAEETAQPAADPRIAEEVRRFTQAQQERITEDDERNPVLPALRTNPFGAAGIVLDRWFTKDGVRLLICYRQDWYHYKQECWRLVSEGDVRSAVFKCLLNCRQVDVEGEIHGFVTKPDNVNIIYFQIQQNEVVQSGLTPPCVREPDGSWREIDGRGLMVCRGQLVDMMTGKARPTLYTFIPNGAEWRYDPNAPEPKRWHQFLEELFNNKTNEIELLQEWFGYVLSGDTWAQKGLIIVGPKRGGKGTIGHVLAKLLGDSMVSSPAINAIGDRFGLQDSISKRLLLVSDAHLSSKKDTMAVIENLLRIIGNDPIMVDRKGKEPVTDQLGVRVMLLTNELPRLADSSDAIMSRFLILKLTRSFFSKEEHDLLDTLTAELPGIALWAVKGYRRLRERDRGRFLEPESSMKERRDWYKNVTPLKEFVEDYCVTYLENTDAEIEPVLLHSKYTLWRKNNGIVPAEIGRNTLSRELRTMLGDDAFKVGKNAAAKRVWKGIDLNKDGKELKEEVFG